MWNVYIEHFKSTTTIVDKGETLQIGYSELSHAVEMIQPGVHLIGVLSSMVSGMVLPCENQTGILPLFFYSVTAS